MSYTWSWRSKSSLGSSVFDAAAEAMMERPRGRPRWSLFLVAGSEAETGRGSTERTEKVRAGAAAIVS